MHKGACNLVCTICTLVANQVKLSRACADCATAWIGGSSGSNMVIGKLVLKESIWTWITAVSWLYVFGPELQGQSTVCGPELRRLVDYMYLDLNYGSQLTVCTWTWIIGFSWLYVLGPGLHGPVNCMYLFTGNESNGRKVVYSEKIITFVVAEVIRLA